MFGRRTIIVRKTPACFAARFRWGQYSGVLGETPMEAAANLIASSDLKKRPRITVKFEKDKETKAWLDEHF